MANSEILRSGKTYTLNYAGPDGIINLDESDRFFAPANVDDQLIATDNGDHINVQVRRSGSVRGLLGNNDGNRDNDFALRDGTQLANPPFETIHGIYADSWRIREGESLFGKPIYQAEYNPEIIPSIELLEEFAPLFVENARLAIRNTSIPDGPISDAMIVDLAITGGWNFFDDAVRIFANNKKIDGTPGRDELTGTDGNQMITGHQGRDPIDGGGGDDLFAYVDIRDAGDILKNFQVAEEVNGKVTVHDQIALLGLFNSLGLHLDYKTLTDGGYLTFGARGGDTLILIDPDGASGLGRAIPFITVEGVSVAELNNPANFFVY